MPYEKTTWVNGGPPGVSAPRLNNLESQYDEVKVEVGKADGSSDIPVHGSNLVDGSVTAAKVAADVATQVELDAQADALSAHTGATSVHSATSAATANRIMMRDASGRAKVAAPSAADDIARKDTVDAGVAAGLGSVWDAINSLNHDQYNLHMELYYTGHHGGPSIAGLTGMTFDGFLDLLRVDVANTTAVVDTANQVVRCAVASTTNLMPVSAAGQYVPGLSNQSHITTIANPVNAVDGDTGTYASVQDDAATLTMWLDLGQERVVTGLRMYAEVYQSDDNVDIGGVATSIDGVTWQIVGKTGGSSSIPADPAWMTISLVPSTARYVAFEIATDEDGGGGESKALLYEVQVTVANYAASSILRCTPKALEDPVDEALAYVSASVPTGCSVAIQVSADNGAHWETMTEQSSRADPQFPGFDEREYSRVLQYPGGNVILGATLNSNATRTFTPVIKRYGLYWS